MNENEISRSDDKRFAPRYKTKLRSAVLLTAIKLSDEAEIMVLKGELLDVSVSGLALIISEEDMAELNKMGSDVKLQLLLPLPSQAIELEAIPVRYRKLQTSENSGVLLGASISNMSGRDRVLFMDFINRQRWLEEDKLKREASMGRE